VDSARPEDVEAVLAAAAEMNPAATVVKTRSCISVDEPERIEGARVLAIEDGPTVTHGGMAYGAGALAAKEHGAIELVDPRPYAVGSLADTLADFPHLTEVLPAMGYSAGQLADLEETIRRTPCDLVLVGTPIDLTHLIDIDQPTLRVTYSVESAGEPSLETVVGGFVERMGLGASG
jgi:predicted GTPase